MKYQFINKNSQYFLGLLMAAVGTIFFSSKSVIIQWLYTINVPIDQLILMRMIISLPFYSIAGILSWRYLIKNGKDTPNTYHIVCIIFSGFLCYHVASYLDMWALQYISAGLERIILFSYPLLVSIRHHFTYKALKRYQWFGILLCYFGVILFYLEDQKLSDNNLLFGVIAVIIAAILSAYYVLSCQYYSQKYSSSLFTSIAMGATSFSISAHVLLLPSESQWVYTSDAFIGIFIIALVCTVIASFLLSLGISKSGAVSGTVSSMSAPLITILLASHFLDGIFNLYHLAAISIVIIGCIVYNFETLSGAKMNQEHT